MDRKTHKRKHGPLYHALKLRCMTVAELAQRVGVSRRTIHNLSCGNHRSKRTRLLIEAELRMPIWSESDDASSPISTVNVPNENQDS